jgi:DNA-binding NtrC family response regulator
MSQDKKQILILHEDPVFLNALESVCLPLGEIYSIHRAEEALEPFSLIRFDLLLLQWDLFSTQGSLDFNSFCQLQPESVKVAIFKNPDLKSVVSAMKSGVVDVLSAQMELASLAQKIQDYLSGKQAVKIRHVSLAPFIETLTQNGMESQTTLYQARKEFYKLFVRIICGHSNLTRERLASLLEVSPRTLQRYITRAGVARKS